MSLSLFIVHCLTGSRFICLYGLTNEVLHLFDALREFLHVAAHFLRRDLRVDLRRADTPVSQHFRERFDGHVVRQTNGRRVAVATLMPRDVLFDTALLRYRLDAVLAVGVSGNW